MSEQDKRPVFMGNFERFKKETHVKHDDVMLQLVSIKRVLRYTAITSTVAFVLAITALAI